MSTVLQELKEAWFTNSNYKCITLPFDRYQEQVENCENCIIYDTCEYINDNLTDNCIYREI